MTPMIFGLTVGLAGFLVAAYPDMHLFTRDVAPVYWVFVGLFFSLAMRSGSVHPEVVNGRAVVRAPSRPSFVPVHARRRVGS
jgi:hypothetical protein